MFRLVAISAALLASLPAVATTITRASLDELITKSSTIVRGRITRVYGVRSGSLVNTQVQVRVLERLKGSEAQQVEVVVPGGVAGGLRQNLPGVPDLVEGAEHVFFLWTARSGRILLMGLAQGVLDVGKTASGETMVTRSAIDARFVDAGSGQAVDPEAISLRYSDFAERVRRVLAREVRK
ncbi:MAG: hypothetical protein ACKV22_01135 [Bryobacteraceae bacterium]